jgi:hypothetical protein
MLGVKKSTLRRILLNQEEIMRALMILLYKQSPSTAEILREASELTVSHVALNYPNKGENHE